MYQSVKDEEWVDPSRVNKAWACWHWVWLSGYWATKKAERWKTYKEILKYYYQDIKIDKI